MGEGAGTAGDRIVCGAFGTQTGGVRSWGACASHRLSFFPGGESLKEISFLRCDSSEARDDACHFGLGRDGFSPFVNLTRQFEAVRFWFAAILDK
jgi:hypothetical protein